MEKKFCKVRRKVVIKKAWKYYEGQEVVDVSEYLWWIELIESHSNNFQLFPEILLTFIWKVFYLASKKSNQISSKVLYPELKKIMETSLIRKIVAWAVES